MSEAVSHPHPLLYRAAGAFRLHFEPEHKMSIAERLEELEKQNRRLQARVDELEAFERSRGEIAAGKFSTIDDLKAEVEAEEHEAVPDLNRQVNP